MPELDPTLYERLLAMNATAERHLARGECKTAARIYLEALDLLPKPIEQWETATWLSGRAANALFMDRQYRAALQELERTMHLPGASENPFLRLRRGQSLYEVGDLEAAKQDLLMAYQLAGETIFESGHPKYFAFTKEHLHVQREQGESTAKAELDDILYQRILTISASADTHVEQKDYPAAVRLYLEALDLLPKPIEQWDAATWLSGCAADTLFLSREYAAAQEELRRTMRLPGAIENPFLRLRRGQVWYEMGSLERAKPELLTAYMLAGEDIFKEDDPKYFACIKDMVDGT
jgi:tetratricopeptide (TPR) repeat protein